MTRHLDDERSDSEIEEKAKRTEVDAINQMPKQILSTEDAIVRHQVAFDRDLHALRLKRQQLDNLLTSSGRLPGRRLGHRRQNNRPFRVQSFGRLLLGRAEIPFAVSLQLCLSQLAQSPSRRVVLRLDKYPKSESNTVLSAKQWALSYSKACTRRMNGPEPVR
jgi:hypothetical protein